MEPLFELQVTAAAPGSRDIASHLFQQLRDAILDRRLPRGSRLPATRGAQRAFGVSRNTAQDVYDRLAQDGLVWSRHGSGTFVRNASADTPAAMWEPAEFRPRNVNPVWNSAEIASWIGFWHEQRSADPAPIVADLRPALVDQALFPHATFRRVMARQLRRLETRPASSRSPQGNQGNGPLRHAIARHIGETRAVACRAEDVLVTSGAQQAFDLIARAMVVPNRTVVAVEDPGYPPMRVPFAAAHARLVPVPVDAEGIIVDAIPADAGIVCVCPSHQFPLGMPMSQRRREALLGFARRHGAIIVEDDYDGEFRFDGSPLEALRGTSSAGQVLYVGSFSKCMSPALRLGFVVAPPCMMPALIAAKNATDWHSSVPVQVAVAGFMHDGHLARHIRRVRRIYRERRHRLLELLEDRFGGVLTVIPSFYGMHVAALVDDAVDCEALSERLAERGVMIHSLARYFLGPSSRSGLIFGYASSDTAVIDRAVATLAIELRGPDRRLALG